MIWSQALEFYKEHYDPDTNVAYTTVGGLRQAMIRSHCVDRDHRSNAKATETRVREFIKVSANHQSETRTTTNNASPMFNSQVGKASIDVVYSEKALSHTRRKTKVSESKPVARKRANISELLRPYGDWRS